MYNSIKLLYRLKKITAAGVAEAVVKGWITPEQFKEIVDGDNIA